MDWDDSRIIEAEPGDYITIARKAKNSKKWFLGAITDENRRTATVTLDFLDKGVDYNITVYRDGDDAHWDKNPMSYKIEKSKVNAGTVLNVLLAEGGGFAASIVPVAPTKLKNTKK
jgi:hypothetical protein